MDKSETQELVETVRDKLDLNQEQFARVAGVSQTTVNRWEQGHSKPSDERLEHLKKLKEKIDEEEKDARAKLLMIAGAVAGLGIASSPIGIFLGAAASAYNENVRNFVEKKIKELFDNDENEESQD